MIDARTKHLQDRFWDRIGRVVARTGITANQVTWFGLAASLANAAVFVLWPKPLVFAVGIVLFELTDDLDGAVARVTGTASKSGAYLDAVTDRYKDAAMIAALAWVHGAWLPAFAAVFGAMQTSYAKARAGMETPVSNVAWPDLFERFERVVAFVVLVLATALFPAHASRIATGGLVVFAILTNASAVQRFFRARTLLSEVGAEGTPGDDGASS
ncbi:MAG: CDP-alcohol phosphatidyltransferase family protein [Polyangiaceae bacterium]